MGIQYVYWRILEIIGEKFWFGVIKLREETGLNQEKRISVKSMYDCRRLLHIGFGAFCYSRSD